MRAHSSTAWKSGGSSRTFSVVLMIANICVSPSARHRHPEPCTTTKLAAHLSP